MQTLKKYIIESFVSFNPDKLTDKLKAITGDKSNFNWTYEKKYNAANTVIWTVNDTWILDDDSDKTAKLKDCPDAEKIYKVLSFFNYYISAIIPGDVDGEFEERPKIFLEPRYTVNVTKKWIKKNRKNNIFYHVTRTSNVDNILKKGLKPKSGKSAAEGGYRIFDEKVFLIANTENIIDDINEIVESLTLAYDDYTVLKIDLGRHNIDLYVDDAYTAQKFELTNKNSSILYTYEAIPPQLISIVDYDNDKFYAYRKI